MNVDRKRMLLLLMVNVVLIIIDALMTYYYVVYRGNMYEVNPIVRNVLSSGFEGFLGWLGFRVLCSVVLYMIYSLGISASLMRFTVWAMIVLVLFHLFVVCSNVFVAMNF